MSYCLKPNCQKPQNPPESLFCLNCGSKLILRERYRALKVIGQGGFGKTFLAVDRDKPSKPRCVIKQFYPQAQGTDNAQKAAELFEREAVRLDDLGKHPQIPELLAHFTQDTHQYLVQQFIDGQNLAQILEKEGILKEAQIRHLLNSLLPVLQFIHDRDVIHRDIKPENIIQKNNGELVLVDFGAAKYATGTALIKTGTVIGTAEYIAPEQSRGKAVFTSDLYSLGVTCIHLLTGVSPFDLFDVGEDCWVWRQFLVDNPVNDDLGVILDNLIKNAANHRYKSGQEVIKILNDQPVKINRYSNFVPTNFEVLSTPVKKNYKKKRIQNSFSVSVFASPLQIFNFEVVRLNNTGEIIDKCARQAEFFAEHLGGEISLEMVAIPGGTFMMGSPDNEEERNDNESPQHQVTIAPFCMGKYPVTQEQFEAVMNYNPSRLKFHPNNDLFAGIFGIFVGNNSSRFQGNSQKKSVENVSWHEANEFCRKLSEKTGKNYRLPSEAEWEYAARAGTITPFHFGKTVTTEVANYKGIDWHYNGKTYIGSYGNAPKGSFREQTTEVGSFPPNAFGLYDIHGNIWEWCIDFWHENYNGAPSDGSVWESGGDSNSRTLRGGSWGLNPGNCRSALRYCLNPDNRSDSYGFRVVADV
ncbi:bifunctional serine/threonine-protein kinase/formylglycine-generating enzyme family protein [Merismopedia glauca]|uniref:Serine/threonine protein kinase n=1 Tax=Merismopedia glauca CCAP 1448/3 TaxID=1296344 RepID=A0A2T1CAA1_9CYAN|nr:bifunctional serine/threonine-protein kinase/formylglycine-generating enzyme family protein [Merismopedia glauca]PSB05200.1 serine/threonine protein kinase [Merismopedia glauca CCAP 1448/3]